MQGRRQDETFLNIQCDWQKSTYLNWKKNQTELNRKKNILHLRVFLVWICCLLMVACFSKSVPTEAMNNYVNHDANKDGLMLCLTAKALIRYQSGLGGSLTWVHRAISLSIYRRKQIKSCLRSSNSNTCWFFTLTNTKRNEETRILSTTLAQMNIFMCILRWKKMCICFACLLTKYDHKNSVGSEIFQKKKS